MKFPKLIYLYVKNLLKYFNMSNKVANLVDLRYFLKIILRCLLLNNHKNVKL